MLNGKKICQTILHKLSALLKETRMPLAVISPVEFLSHRCHSFWPSCQNPNPELNSTKTGTVT